MQVRPGFKRTEAGVLPVDWEEQHLSSLITTGPKNGYSGRSSKSAHGTPTLSLGATTLGLLVLNDETVKRLEETIDSDSDLFLQSGDVLVQRSNTLDLVGTTAIFDGPSGVYVYPDLMMRMRFSEGATAHWFWRYANSASGRRFFMAVAAGSSGSMPKLSGDRLRRMLVPIPPLPEQRAIAVALNDVDALLGGLDRLITKKRDLKQAAMQQLLSCQLRLPKYHGKWEVTRLGDVADVLKGSGLSKGNIGPSGARLCILYGELFTTYSRVILAVGGRTDSVEGIESVFGDVLMPGSTTTSGVDLAVASALLKDGVALGGDINIIRRRGESYDPAFLANYLTTMRKREIVELTQGITIHHLYGRDLKTLSLELPPVSEQTAIAAVLSDMDAELTALETRRAKIRDLKQAMMQELLTGKTRLIQPEAVHA
jgi:type I restriction enzyme, S subunit